MQNRMVYRLLIVFLPFIILGLATATFTRNMAWTSSKSLWMDAMQKAPRMARPYQQVAMALEGENRLDEALKLYERSLDLDDPNPKLSRFISLGNMGNIYKKKGDYAMAVKVLQAAMTAPKGPYVLRVRYNLVLCMLNTNQVEEAFAHINRLHAMYPGNHQFIITRGFLLQLHGHMHEARKHFQVALKQSPTDWRSMYHLGMALSAAGRRQRADWFLLRARNKAPMQLGLHLALLQNAIAMQQPERVSKYLSEITNRFELFRIASFFAKRAKGYHLIDGMLVLLDDDIVRQRLADHMKETARMLDTHLAGNK